MGTNIVGGALVSFSPYSSSVRLSRITHNIDEEMNLPEGVNVPRAAGLSESRICDNMGGP